MEVNWKINVTGLKLVIKEQAMGQLNERPQDLTANF